MACTTILVGKKATYDGSTFVARNEDSPSGQFTPKKFTVVQPKEQPKHYKSLLAHTEIPLPEKAMRYTCMPDALGNMGIWGAFGVNELNVSMSATETITSNERVLAADPLVEFIPAKGNPGEDGYQSEQIGGISEEDFVTLILPYMTSARDGVIRLGKLLEEYGTYEMNGIAFQDVDEIWWLETIGGHHWIAKRVPDDSYVVMPNQLGIDSFDFDDAFGEQVEHMCSSDMREFVKDNHLDLSLNDEFNPRDAFGSHSDADHVYNTPRAWIIQRYFNPKTSRWDGCHADYKPMSDNIPWSRKPERKITVEDIKYTLSHHFQGTPYDPYNTHGDLSQKGSFRPIGINRNNVLGLVQIRPYMPEAIRSLEWIAYGSNVFNAFVPFYANINQTPEYMGNTTAEVTTNNFYWANRLIGAMADSHFAENASHIERYQNELQARASELVHNADQEFLKNPVSYWDASEFCQKVNQDIATLAKEQTQDTLDKVLYTSSSLMQNGFSRSDA
ncbi:dipeptidase [Granulicatella balaenopterae]|uniref:Dipeptidase n=1 Tax=Granulicatella balaenopterae TaxID=137733 RepID=A0A1H9H8T2_9LACT|nr:C69 family dipeptidase [Granulicatella balaenopterae]SEQ58722.1 dipeptidase [Granulicatella balaenopterae]